MALAELGAGSENGRAEPLAQHRRPARQCPDGRTSMACARRISAGGCWIELVLPSQDRRRLRFPLSSRADIGLPGPIDKAVILVDGRIITAIETGRLFVIRPD
jgi:hypothetical protein